MPSRRTVTRKLTGGIDKLKKQRIKEIKEAMDGGNVIRTTMDLWTGAAGQ